ncbi:MAG: trypsin-like peptidase domain-containing protein [Desmonostoc vinosum HA7617-LM4]|jgi:S1-C subfamily serine protease|nr:trypsin-like peptidase domain-containing protein [Desmonostoc vinosum HA7617-LM4]
MLNNTNKTNKKFFALFASALLAANLLTGCGDKKIDASDSQNNGVAVAQSNPNKPSQNNSDTTQNNGAIAIQNPVSLADYTKPAVVQIVSGCTAKVRFSYNDQSKVYDVSAGGSGSGFFVNSDGYIITNVHVIEATKNPEECQKALFQNYVEQIAQDLGVNPSELLKNPEGLQEIDNNSQFVEDIQQINSVILPNSDALPFEIKVSGAPVGQGKDVAVIKVEIKNAPVLKLADSEQVQIQNKIVAMGYPGINPDILDNTSFAEATITSGEISAKKRLADGSPVFQISASVTHGNSGGPVLNSKGEVIGMTTFGGEPVNGQEVSGFAFAFTSNTIMEFVRQAGVGNEKGVVDELYRDGLQFYSQGAYTQAIEKFETVKRLFPQHSEVNKLIQECQGKIVGAK